MGTKYEVLRFFLDGYELGNAGRDGGGGGNICCVLLPRKWRADLAVELRWEVADWRKVDPNMEKQNNFSQVQIRNYRAGVPVEKYTNADRLGVHFF